MWVERFPEVAEPGFQSPQQVGIPRETVWFQAPPPNYQAPPRLPGLTPKLPGPAQAPRQGSQVPSPTPPPDFMPWGQAGNLRAKPPFPGDSSVFH
jgi:hypothetical protein